MIEINTKIGSLFVEEIVLLQTTKPQIFFDMTRAIITTRTIILGAETGNRKGKVPFILTPDLYQFQRQSERKTLAIL